MNIAAKAAMLGEEPTKSRKQERVEKKVGRLAGKLLKLDKKGENYASTNTPEGEQSGKERRYHKKVNKVYDKLKEASNEEIGMGAKNSKTDFTRVPKDDKPASSSSSTMNESPTQKKRGKYSDANFTTVGTKEEVEKQPKKTEFTKVGTEDNTAKRNSDDVYTRTLTESKTPEKKTEFTRVGTEEETEKQSKKDKREWTNVPQDKTPTATTTPSDTETKAAVAAGKYSLTKFKPKK